MLLHYELIEKLSENRQLEFGLLKDEIMEHVQRGASDIDCLCPLDRRMIIGMFLNCLTNESRYYFITESGRSDEIIDCFCSYLQHPASAENFLIETEEVAYEYYKDYIDAIFQHVIYICSEEEMERNNRLEVDWRDQNERFY